MFSWCSFFYLISTSDPGFQIQCVPNKVSNRILFFILGDKILGQSGQKRLKRPRKPGWPKVVQKYCFPTSPLKFCQQLFSGHLLYIFDYALYQIYITTDPRFQMGLVGGKVHRALRSKLHQLLIWTRAPLQWRVEGAITLSVNFPLPNFWTASNKKNLDYIDLRSVLRSPDLRCYHPFNDLTIAKSMSVPSAS